LLREWQIEIKRLLLVLTGALLVGALFGSIPEAIALALVGYLAHSFRQLYIFQRWLRDIALDYRLEPPVSTGVWGEIFDGIYRLQRREREAALYLKNILDKAQESSAALEMAVVMINARGNLSWWNKAAEVLLGFRQAQDQQQSVTNLLREPRFIDYFEKNNYADPLRIPSPSNKKQMLEFQITLFGEGERLMLVRDVSQMHRLESMRSDFVGNVSHELRTPITVINGYLETLLDHQDAVAPRWIKPLQQMHQQAQRMENIVRDLLTLTRLETKALPRVQEEIHVPSLLREVKNEAELAFAAKQHHFELVCEGEYRLRGSMNELYSAVSNLVFNAAKYTPERGEIHIRLGRTGSGLTIEVQDNGAGIEEHHLPRLTERFYRVDESRSTDRGGTGLGLAIVKHVLARHGANLQIASTVGVGSRFTCQFPAERVLADAAPGTALSASA
jgi:two-component system phosphate regulon sensor histidine kinase PhoR